jgi:hypothetical protein
MRGATKVVNITTRTSHYESATVSGTAYTLDARRSTCHRSYGKVAEGWLASSHQVREAKPARPSSTVKSTGLTQRLQVDPGVRLNSPYEKKKP